MAEENDSQVSAAEMREVLNGLGKATHALHEYVTRKDTETKEKGEAAPETKEALERINDAIDAAEDAKERARQLELKIARMEQLPSNFGGGARTPDLTDVEKKRNEAMLLYMRKGEGYVDPEKATLVAGRETKLLSSDSAPDGGYVVTTTVERTVRLKLIEFSPIRELADVQTITGESWEGPAEGSQDFEAGWTSERGNRPVTATGQLRLDKIPAEEMYARPKTTQKMLDDAGFDIESWLSNRLILRFRVVEGLAFVSGTGAGQPEGLLVKSGVSEVVSGHATQITADGWINLLYDLPEYYARNSVFLLKRSTLRATRILKDGQNQYLWQPGLANGQPSQILERPYRETIDMPAIGAGTYPVALGDWKTAYRVIDRQGIRTLRNPYLNPGFIEFYSTMRVGGAVIMAEAMRKMKIAAS